MAATELAQGRGVNLPVTLAARCCHKPAARMPVLRPFRAGTFYKVLAEGKTPLLITLGSG
jgi:hypothetical protein